MFGGISERENFAPKYSFFLKMDWDELVTHTAKLNTENSASLWELITKKRDVNFKVDR